MSWKTRPLAVDWIMYPQNSYAGDLTPIVMVFEDGPLEDK